MFLKYYEGINIADKTKRIFYVDLSKVSRVEIIQTKIENLDKYTFVLDGNEISRIFAARGGCLYYLFDSREEVEKLIDDILYCHLTNKARIYDLDENIRKLHLSLSRGYRNGR